MIALTLAQCGASPEPPVSNVATVTCGDAVLSRSDPRWREQAAALGPFGLYGPGRDFDNARRFGERRYMAKLPAIVEGRRAVTVRVSPDQRNGVLLHYSGHRPSEALTFEPCRDQAITAWSGEMILESREPATLEVQVENGQPTTLLVGRPAT